MEFILINHSAASAVVTDRQLQSTSFQRGKFLAELVRGGLLTQEALVGRGVIAVDTPNGRYILGSPKVDEHCVVFDLAACDPFREQSEAHSLAVLQRVLRAAVRLWEGLTPSSHDRLLPSKVVVFPVPNSLYRVALHRVTIEDGKITAAESGASLLAYQDGESEGGGPTEQPDTSRMQLAVKEISKAVTTLMDRKFPGPAFDGDVIFAVAELSDLTEKYSPFQGFDTWMHNLTSTQRAFVSRPTVTGPERLDGAAGTGKTICLVLRCINVLRSARESGQEHHSIFLTYGDAQKTAIETLIDSNDPWRFREADRNSSKQSLKITTLQSWCGDGLNVGVADLEYLDRDAMSARDTRLLYINEAIDDARKEDLSTFAPLLSRRFASFFESETTWSSAEMLQHEFAVVIKGRVGENLERYQKMQAVGNNLPIGNEHDRAFVFSIFKRYQRRLEILGQFDTDDVVLTAMGQLDTPIWRRRRIVDGFDSVFVDETHLFNFNEISVFHYLTRAADRFPIVFSVDRTQAPGDRGLTNAVLEQAIGGATAASAVFGDVFRCSPDITGLALAVLSSGATLFSNFDNPLSGADSAFTLAEEKLTRRPKLIECVDDVEMVSVAIERAKGMASDMGVSRGRIVIIPFAGDIMAQIKRAAGEARVGLEIIERRGDIDVLKRAQSASRIVVGAPDYVGGLEFAGAVLVGVDKNRVPPSEDARTPESKHFLSFAAHARVYVALTRARFRVEVLINKTAGPSDVFGLGLRSFDVLAGA